MVIDGSARKEFMFDSTIFEDFIINEKLYLASNIVQYEVLKTLDTTIVITKGPYTDAFYAEKFGQMQFGKKFLLCDELDLYLEKAKACEPDLIVYLDASREEIISRYKKDEKRRSSMKEFLNNWLDSFEYFYKSNNKTIVIDTNNIDSESVYKEFVRVIEKI